MDIVNSIVAGMVGTLFMTLFVNVGAKATGYNFHVPSILGSMMLRSTKPSGKPSRSPATLTSGYITHYLIGIAFALIYAQISTGNGKIQYSNALLFGVIAGLIAAGFWFAALKLHPLAPRIRLLPYLVLIFIGHLVFFLGVNMVLRTMS